VWKVGHEVEEAAFFGGKAVNLLKKGQMSDNSKVRYNFLRIFVAV
jgi:hypothetical protein